MILPGPSCDSVGLKKHQMFLQTCTCAFKFLFGDIAQDQCDKTFCQCCFLCWSSPSVCHRQSFVSPAMILSVKRQVADPSLGVGDMMRVLRAEMASKASWDLWKYLLHPQANAKFNWRTAPHPGYMAQTADLMYRFCSIAPNAVLSGSKLRQAILKLGHERKINWSKYNEDEFSDRCDFKVRVLLAQFRLLKQRTDDYTRCMRKASEAEQLAIDKVLAIMCLDKDGGDKDETLNSDDRQSCAVAAAPSSSSTNALPVPLVASRRDGSAAKGIFQRILQKQDSNTSTDEQQMEPLPLVALPKEEAVPPQGTFKKGQHRPPGVGVLPEEDVLLPASPMVAKQLGKKKQRISASSVAAKKGVKQGAHGFSDDDLEVINEALDNNILNTGSAASGASTKKNNPKKNTMKKPSSSHWKRSKKNESAKKTCFEEGCCTS